MLKLHIFIFDILLNRYAKYVLLSCDEFGEKKANTSLFIKLVENIFKQLKKNLTKKLFLGFIMTNIVTKL